LAAFAGWFDGVGLQRLARFFFLKAMHVVAGVLRIVESREQKRKLLRMKNENSLSQTSC
jgi:hypothetical protein